MVDSNFYVRALASAHPAACPPQVSAEASAALHSSWVQPNTKPFSMRRKIWCKWRFNGFVGIFLEQAFVRALHNRPAGQSSSTLQQPKCLKKKNVDEMSSEIQFATLNFNDSWWKFHVFFHQLVTTPCSVFDNCLHYIPPCIHTFVMTKNCEWKLTILVANFVDFDVLVKKTSMEKIIKIGSEAIFMIFSMEFLFNLDRTEYQKDVVGRHRYRYME